MQRLAACPNAALRFIWSSVCLRNALCCAHGSAHGVHTDQLSGIYGVESTACARDHAQARHLVGGTL